MATADRSAATATPDVGVVALSDTMSESLLTLPAWASALDVYLADSAAGTWGPADSSSAPLPGQVWTRVWDRAGSPVPDQTAALYFAAASGTPNLHYRIT